MSDQAFTQRQLKASENLKKIIARIFNQEQIVLSEINVKFVTITEVRISKDFKSARVYFVPLNGLKSELYLETLNKHSNVIKFEVAKAWTAKFMPNLKFIADESFDYAQKIENIIKKNQN